MQGKYKLKVAKVVIADLGTITAESLTDRTAKILINRGFGMYLEEVQKTFCDEIKPKKRAKK
jgi:hypothetical protein